MRHRADANLNPAQEIAHVIDAGSPSALPGLCDRLRPTARGEVAGPVSFGVADPFDGGVDVHAEKVGEHGGGQVGGQVDQGRAAGDPDLDAVVAELADEAVDGKMPARYLAGEQPGGRGPASAEHGGWRSTGAELADEPGQGRRQEDRVLAKGEVGAAVAVADLGGFI